MKRFIFSLVCLVSLSAWSEVSKDNVDDMIKQMVADKVISSEEGERARAKLKTMNSDQWQAINAKAMTQAARYPASASTSSTNKIEEVGAIDLDGAQFKQIQNDLKMIVPSSKDQ